MRKVTHARFHQSVHIAGAGEMGSCLPPMKKNLPDLVMKTDGQVLFVSFKVGVTKVAAEIPCANIICVTTDGDA